MRVRKMIAVNLNIQESVYEKVMYFLKSLPKQDIQIITKRVIEEIDPAVLHKDHFDYISQKELNEMDYDIKQAKKQGFENLQTYEEFKSEL